MDIVLLERVENLGHMGDVVKVKPGYARNYLLPQKKALRATKANLDYFEHRKADLSAQNVKRRDEADAIAKKLEGLTIVLIRQASEAGQLYGSVAPRDIAETVSEAGYKIERRHVALNETIKTIGLSPVRINLHPEVSVGITVNVARSEEEAKVQASGGKAEAEPTEENVYGLEEEQPAI